ncbi:MAG: prepilin-type N-terminal cleavage/methylation domain-containing protein [Planctomycetaceae bacterium]|nr:prepilin-type N-terminal cleavage/methylation domain-containing protein [Planctomycetaceae bacterium]
MNRSSRYLPNATRRPHHRVARRGLSLLEIMLALVILGLTIAAIAPLQARGVRAGLQASLETEAHLRCQAILKERISKRQFEDQSSQPFADDRRWTWSVETARQAIPQLLEMRVIVEHQSSNRDGQVRCAIAQLVQTQSEDPARADRRRRMP